MPPANARDATSARPSTALVRPAPPWEADVLGQDYRRLTLPLGQDDEGDVVATLVRRQGAGPTPHGAVLFIHGWNEYFFHTGIADYWIGQGWAFYALDLRKYGRSMREWTTPGYVTDLTDYDMDIDTAIAAISADLGHVPRIVVMAHSTGGLIACLWARRHPGLAHALILSSPWLELQGKAALRLVATPGVGLLAKQTPKAELPNVDLGFNNRTLAVAAGGEWTFDPSWRPNPQFPVRPGWLEAILDGHAEVAKGLELELPILMLTSTRSILTTRWREEMRHADVVLDVEAIVQRAPHLGRLVTLARIPGALHEVFLSAPQARALAYREVTRWSRAYLSPEPDAAAKGSA